MQTNNANNIFTLNLAFKTFPHVLWRQLALWLSVKETDLGGYLLAM